MVSGGHSDFRRMTGGSTSVVVTIVAVVGGLATAIGFVLVAYLRQ